MMKHDEVFTIGHSTNSQERFVGLLRQHGITALCDVRSKPLSRTNPQFNLDALRRVLPACSIEYLFLGKELGARSDDPSCYEAGRVQYERLACTEHFLRGLARIQDGLNKGFRIVLMCAEREPLECHRTILIARYLELRNIDVKHILADGSLENHRDSLKRLARIVDIPEDDILGRSPEDLIDEAYRRQENRIAYQLKGSFTLRKSPALQGAGR